ncbi:MAG: family 10 glycosylhydrolase [Ruminococcus sp.]|nr:family 10 glycosylhydrolase [Ruminococcus sp.]
MKNKVINNFPIILSVCILIVLLALSNIKGEENAVPENPKVIQTVSVPKGEMRGLWVTYIDLDMSGTDYSFNSFKTKFNNIANKAKKNRFNTLIVQVRPFSDALYKSKYYPCSHIISGKQGKNTDYDALQYMVEYCHKKGLKIHAWVNPYRVKNKGGLRLSKDNPYIKNKKLGVRVNGGIYLNPALEKVRTLIENGIKEIVRNYDVDGVQFDDYFYPTNKKSFDKAQYNKYKKKVKTNAVPLDEWRMANVNTLVYECNAICHKSGKLFGISPQGNIRNNYGLYADVKSWCSKYGYVDYICPQLYYSIKNPALRFYDALKEWQALKYNKSVTLYIGLAGYKAGTKDDSGTWKNKTNILKRELKLIRKNNIKGFMLYSYADLNRKGAKMEITNLVKALN